MGFKSLFWEEIRKLGSSWDGPWLRGGSFNAIRSRDEKRGYPFFLIIVEDLIG
jgi:hypothetical protein